MPRLGLVAVVLFGLAACAACADPEPPPPPPDAGLVVRDDLALRWSELPLWPAGSVAPAAYATARTQWRTATTAFSYGAYDDAARGFLATAETLRASLDAGAAATIFGVGRCQAYENAAAVLAGTNAPETHRGALEAVVDPACANSLARLKTKTATAAR